MMDRNKFHELLEWAGYVLAGVVITALLILILL